MTEFKPLACGFHSHTDLSLDGASTVAAKIKRAAALGRVADCVTDHGIMSALVPHWEAAAKLHKSGKIDKPIRSIHGIEAYIIDPDRPPKELKNGKLEHPYMHLTIHFKTKEAYRYFCSLTPVMEERALVRWGERKPLLKLEELEPISGQITIGSGCLVGPVQKNVLNGRSDLARKNYIRLRELAGPGNFFVEVFPHIIDHEWKKPQRNSKKEVIVAGKFEPITTTRRDEDAIDPEPCSSNGIIDIQKDPNAFVMALAHEFGDPVVISLDDHYACDEDKIVQDTRLGNGLENWKFYGSYASHTSEYCADMLKKQLDVSDRQIEEWIDNSYKFVDLFNDYTLETAKDRWLLPNTEMVYNIQEDSVSVATRLIKEHGRMPPEDHPEYKIYKDRLDYEIDVLKNNGVADFLPYFFVLEDAGKFAKKNDIMLNTRGSAGGSLLLYLLGVSITDPIKYKLPFERFLTVGRIKSGSLPDIDSDWQDKEMILEYLHEKYGDKFALISTDMMLRLKTSILDVERSNLGLVRPETAKMCKRIKGAPQGVSDEEWLFGTEDKTTGAHIPGFWDDMKDPVAGELRTYAKENPEIWNTVLKCIGITKTRGVHAGGIVLTPDPVKNYVPLIHTNKGLATAYNMKYVESVGAVKYDFLGVSTLKAIGIALKGVNDELPDDQKLEWKEFPHDPEVYKQIIHQDKLAAIFQLNTKTVRPYVSQVLPSSIVDIAALTALIRPGAMDAPSPDPAVEMTAAQYFIEVARGDRKPYFIHPDLEPILGETNGVIVFQEQTLEIFRELAGYSYEQAEVVRRAIGKKIKELLEEHGTILRTKLMERGWTQEQAVRLFDSIMASARYSFNRSHAVSYAMVAYNGCYLKHHHPLHFWKGELTIKSDDHDKIREYLKECSDYILPVDVRKSHPTEWMVENDGLRPPLSLLKGCGGASVEKLKNFIDTPLEDIVIEEKKRAKRATK